MIHELIGHGHEHNVYQSRFPDWVLKTPNKYGQFIFWLFNISPSVIVREHIEAERRLKNSEIKIPQWRIFRFNNGYVTAQQKIIEDGSLTKSEVQRKIQTAPRYFQARFAKHHENFIVQNEELYYIDPTKSHSPIGILDRKGIVTKIKFYQIREKIKQDIKNVMNALDTYQWK